MCCVSIRRSSSSRNLASSVAAAGDAEALASWQGAPLVATATTVPARANRNRNNGGSSRCRRAEQTSLWRKGGVRWRGNLARCSNTHERLRVREAGLGLSVLSTPPALSPPSLSYALGGALDPGGRRRTAGFAGSGHSPTRAERSFS